MSLSHSVIHGTGNAAGPQDGVASFRLLRLLRVRMLRHGDSTCLSRTRGQKGWSRVVCDRARRCG
jgi:hypothetical protein